MRFGVLFLSTACLAEPFDSCCARVECTAEDRAWYERITRKRDVVESGNATLFFAHMRKAAGTTFATAIEGATFGTEETFFKQGFRRTVKIHLAAMSKHCVDDPAAGDVLFVTTFREPVARYVSEYNYRGIGRNHRNSSPEEKIRHWRHPPTVISMRSARDRLIDNWQVRWYTNGCQCVDLRLPPVHDSHPNYSYWRSGCDRDPRAKIIKADLAEAIDVIHKFDVIAMPPYFEGECTIKPLLKLVGGGAADLPERVKNRGSRKLFLDSDAAWIPPELFEFDKRLYRRVKQIERRRRHIACCLG